MLVCTYAQILYSLTTNTLALRIKAARHRYVLISDKNVLPFEIYLFLFLSLLFFILLSLPSPIVVYFGKGIVLSLLQYHPWTIR